eukprot:Gb_31101 [translate_table: standard]
MFCVEARIDRVTVFYIIFCEGLDRGQERPRRGVPAIGFTRLWRRGAPAAEGSMTWFYVQVKSTAGLYVYGAEEHSRELKVYNHPYTYRMVEYALEFPRINLNLACYKVYMSGRGGVSSQLVMNYHANSYPNLEQLVRGSSK